MSARATAYLASVSEELGFSEVESVNERGIVNLRESLPPLATSKGISVGGDFVLDRPTARALASLPMNIDLYPARKSLTFKAGAWSELSDAPDKHLEIQVWPSDSPMSCRITLHHGQHKDVVIKTWDKESRTMVERIVSNDFAS